jgi:Ca2+-binding RTX toxin-like protein
MASDSIVGAVGTGLTEASKELLEAVVAAISGTATVSDIGTSTVVTGTDKSGNSTGALISTGKATTGTINDGVVSIGVVLPEKVGLNFAGPTKAVAAAAAVTYFNDLISAALPSTNKTTAVVEKRASLESAVSLASDGQGSNLFVRVIGITNESTTGKSTDTVKLSGSSIGNKEVVAVNAANLSKSQTLILENLDRVVLVNDAKVQIIGDAAFVAGDNANQSISGGFGADTLVGGGGSDTLVGGYGADKFGFIGGGTTIVGDFNKGQGDKLAIQLTGVTTNAQLINAVSAIQDTPTGMSVTFGSFGTITLVGVKIADITADMIQLNINS